ncbi:RagB/SusD family nutrient uptake outer membrane protein [Maribellus maritimus]|uniref:RagB/SusD family nutrient uptake outer membrane protein n=1 Tax=Maribellus maritimus TaxID=2870838 RepID=UPI001EEB0BB9|nr:RagB/SusD family nutrient uptake outer membrane protein [Maribellus maritimus]MCG6190834.1 RagB/SusD family nutrient uptake outer membrane protein [Maribellus maritimus]
MKKIKLSLIILSLVLLNACEDSIDITPKSVMTSVSMLETEENAESAMYGSYVRLRSTLATYYVYYGDYRTGFWGDGIMNATWLFDVFKNTLDDEDNGTNWINFYRTINDCNLILKHVPNIEFSSEDTRNSILANAYFLRAFCYYYIARIWGDAPIVLEGFESDESKEMYPEREALAKVLSQVAEDVDAAISLFPDDDAGSRKIGSIGAAYMLKTDLYLWLAKTQDGGDSDLNTAKESVQQVLSNSNYMLLDDYETVFTDDGNSEIIFAINQEINEYTGGFASDWLVAIQYVNDQSLVENPIKVGAVQQWTTLTDEFEEFIYENPEDTRSTTTLETFTEDGNRHFKWINKFVGEWTNETRYFTSDPKLYRFAEAILFMAEIENALGNTDAALTQLNRITKRAYGTDNYYSGSYSKEELDEIILNERLKEFTAEGKAWWDLIRFNRVFERVSSLVGRENEENILLWPLNVNTLNTNPNITQTPGYN